MDPGLPAGTVLATERLLLCRFSGSAGEADFLLELLNQPDFLRHIGDKGVRNRAAAQAWMANGPGASYARHGFGMYLAVLRDSGQPVGICGLLQRDWLDTVDIGYALATPFQGRGLAFEAVSAILDHARSQFGLARIAAIVDPANTASIGLLQKAGLQFEGWLDSPDAGRLCRYGRALA